MAGPVQHIDSLETLDALTATHKYVILDFTATWCPPCKVIAPIYEKLAKEYAVEGLLAFGKVDVDDAGPVAARFGVSAMPTFVFLEDGENAGVNVGDAVPAKANIVRVEGSGDVGPLVSIRGADPGSLLLAVKKIAELAAPAEPEESA